MLHPDRFFDPDPAVREIARALYGTTKSLPLVCPHGHVPPELLATNRPFPEPTALLLEPDHYLLRMLYAHGVPMEDLGISEKDSKIPAAGPRKAWQRFAEHFHLFLGTPSRAWLEYELEEILGIAAPLNGDTASAIYDQIQQRIHQPDFRPRTLFERFRIEVLTTTDSPTDRLEHHQALRRSSFQGRMVPCFRPDALFQIDRSEWTTELGALEQVTGSSIGSFAAFVQALEDRRAFFRTLGATSTDHGVEVPRTQALWPREAERLFQRALKGGADAADRQLFEAHMLMEMARMSVEDGMVMQLHAGSLRQHNRPFSDRYGRDRGDDIPVRTEYTRNLRPLLEAYGNDSRFRLVLFTLDEATYARELAPLAGHYPAVRLGPPWWFHDSVEGMKRYRSQVTETAGFWNTAGFNDDTRAFLSIPARHDLSRRIDADYLAGLVARHQLSVDDAMRIARALAVDLVRDTYRLPVPG